MEPKTIAIPYPRAQCQQTKPSRPRQIVVQCLENIRKLLYILLHKENMLVNIVAFLLGRVAILGEISPFGLAFFAAVISVNREKAVGVAIWTIIGLLSTQPGWGAFAAVLAIAVFFRILRGGRIKTEKKLIGFPVLMFSCVLIARLGMTAIFNPSLYGCLLALFDALITLVLTLVFLYGVPMVTRREMGRMLSSEEMISVVVILAAVVAGIPSFTAGNLAINNIAGRLVIMILAYIGGGSMGAAVGVAIGIVFSLAEASVFAGIGFYALAGLLAGLFRTFGKLGVGLGFILGNLILTINLGQSQQIVQSLFETLIAALGLMIMPGKWTNTIRQMIPILGVDTENTDIKLREMSCKKLESLAKVFAEMAAAFNQNAGQLNSRPHEDLIAQMLEEVGEKVCFGCSRRNFCWDREFYRTYRSLTDLLALAEISGGICLDKLPVSFKTNCSRQQELASTINVLLERKQAFSYWQRKIRETRYMVTEQIRGLADILTDFSQEMQKEPCYNEEIGEIIRIKAGELGYQIDEVQVIGSCSSSVEIEIYKQSCAGTQECLHSILPLLNNLLRQKLTMRTECPKVTKRGRCYLHLSTRERFHLVSGIATAAKDASGISGDTYSIMPLRQGKIAVLLSDGMGVGADAARQSATTIHLLQKLMGAGFELDVAVKTVNSLLLLHTPDESFATVDLVVVDMLTGEAEFLKISAVPSFIKRVREVSIVHSSSLPIGILNHIDIESAKRQLVAGDIIVMVTDGVLDAEKKKLEKEEWVAKLLRRAGNENPREIADAVLRKAKEMAGKDIEDDMTVVVLRLDERLPLH